MMSKILLIETATADCSIALLDGEKIVALQSAETPMSHTTQLTLLIQAGLSQVDWKIAELDAIGLSQGPGSYTALRVGAATAKGICYGQVIPLMSIDTLKAISQAMIHSAGATFTDSSRSFPMIDARRMEVYGAIYDGRTDEIHNPQAIILTKEYLIDQIPSEGKLFVGGNGGAKAKELGADSNIILCDIGARADYLAKQALQSYETENFVDLAYFKPLYLKPPNITTPKPVWKEK